MSKIVLGNGIIRVNSIELCSIENSEGNGTASASISGGEGEEKISGEIRSEENGALKAPKG